MKLFVKISLSILLLFILIFGFIYYFTNLKQYHFIQKSIRELEGIQKDRATSEFYSVGKLSNVHAGTIAMINKIGSGGIWIWSNNKLKYFSTNESTEYSFYDVCGLLTQSEEIKTITINDDSKIVLNDLNTWSKKVKKGDFIQIDLLNGSKNTIQKMLAFDIPLFLNININKQCKN